MSYTIVTGDNSLILQTLKVGADPFSVAGLTCKSRLVSVCGHDPLTDVITNSDATAGADWANGVVAIIVPGEQTTNIDCYQHPEVVLETQVDDGVYEKTWFTTVSLTKGSID